MCNGMNGGMKLRQEVAVEGFHTGLGFEDAALAKLLSWLPAHSTLAAVAVAAVAVAAVAVTPKAAAGPWWWAACALRPTHNSRRTSNNLPSRQEFNVKGATHHSICPSNNFPLSQKKRCCMEGITHHSRHTEDNNPLSQSEMLHGSNAAATAKMTDQMLQYLGILYGGREPHEHVITKILAQYLPNLNPPVPSLLTRAEVGASCRGRGIKQRQTRKAGQQACKREIT